jgi:hypothetical protein
MTLPQQKTKRKPAEAWAVFCNDQSTACAFDWNPLQPHGADSRVVHLVERSHAEAAVIRAAVAFLENVSFSVQKKDIPRLARFKRAVSRLLKERKP